jgi:hypothetical protein
MANSNMVGGERGATNAYDTNKQLCNHTDQSLYGLPGLLLAFHCAHGQVRRAARLRAPAAAPNPPPPHPPPRPRASATALVPPLYRR